MLITMYDASVMLESLQPVFKLCRETVCPGTGCEMQQDRAVFRVLRYVADLLEEYDLFFLDSGYGRGSIDAFHVVQQMENSMALIWKPVYGKQTGKIVLLQGTGWLPITAWGRHSVHRRQRGCQKTSGYGSCQTPEGVSQ